MTQRSGLALAVLALAAERPMHPYRMQQLIRERGKDKVANVAQPNSVYQTIERLRRAGLLAVRETAREERRPERTVYELTGEGRATLLRWMRTLLAVPERHFPDFPAVLSLLSLLEPDDVRRQLEARAATLAARVAELEADAAAVPWLPRLFLVEDEYRRVVLQAELTWVQGMVEDLRAGRLTWDEEWIRGVAEAQEERSG